MTAERGMRNEMIEKQSKLRRLSATLSVARGSRGAHSTQLLIDNFADCSLLNSALSGRHLATRRA